MRKAKQSFRVFGLALLAAVSVMAVSAAAAQASGALVINGVELEEGKSAKLEGTGGKGKLIVPGLGLTVECESAKLTGEGKNVLLEPPSSRHASGTFHILFHGCIDVGPKGCEIYPTETDAAKKTNKGLILASGKFLALLLEISPGVTIHVLVITPLVENKPISTWLTVGGTCTLPEETEVSGTAAVKVGNAATEEVEHSVEDLSKTEEEAWNKMVKEKGGQPPAIGVKYGNEPSELNEGNGKGHLLEPFLGKKFSLKK